MATRSSAMSTPGRQHARRWPRRRRAARTCRLHQRSSPSTRCSPGGCGFLVGFIPGFTVESMKLRGIWMLCTINVSRRIVWKCHRSCDLVISIGEFVGFFWEDGELGIWYLLGWFDECSRTSQAALAAATNRFPCSVPPFDEAGRPSSAGASRARSGTTAVFLPCGEDEGC